MERRLYEASVNGSVPFLETLIQQDEFILDRVTSNWFKFGDTPLHLAAMRGHLSFARALLQHKPRLALAVNLSRRSPLHLASAEGYVEIVRELIPVCSQVCSFRDEDGRTPLHLAVLNEHVEVIKALIEGRQELASETLDHGKTVLHLCVEYNRLEALKWLVEWCGDDKFLNSQDDDGNTIFLLAVALKQKETIKHLLTRRELAAKANVVNKKGETCLDVLKHCRPWDYKTLEILDILDEAGIAKANDLVIPEVQPSIVENLPLTPKKVNFRRVCLQGAQRALSKFRRNFLKIDTDNKWLEEARGNLLVAATVMATMAFQAGINPPGGTWQESGKDKDEKTTAGYSITATLLPDEYCTFLKLNTMSLMASLSTILLMISGIPLKHKLTVWLLMLTMCLTIIFTVLTYIKSIYIVTATNETIDATLRYSKISLVLWYGLCALVIVVHSLRIILWLVKKARKSVPRIIASFKTPVSGNEIALPPVFGAPNYPQV